MTYIMISKRFPTVTHTIYKPSNLKRTLPIHNGDLGGVIDFFAQYDIIINDRVIIFPLKNLIGIQEILSSYSSLKKEQNRKLFVKEHRKILDDKMNSVTTYAQINKILFTLHVSWDSKIKHLYSMISSILHSIKIFPDLKEYFYTSKYHIKSI